MIDEQLLATGQTVYTQLTPSCNTRTDATFDLNDTTYVTFYFQNTVPLWQALLSIANQKVTLLQDVVGSGITLKQGLQVVFSPLGTQYTVSLTGTIVDNKTDYNFKGTNLGVFSRTDEMKSAVQAIQENRRILSIL